ncbi:ProQ/FinO family protein [Methylobacterium ajmalii]|uniref:ProQ/FinO family protein n=1 Tax=Methylobacterium ajmalii TaxID=2738439 RepID=A0ABV0A464_9HYPH
MDSPSAGVGQAHKRIDTDALRLVLVQRFPHTFAGRHARKVPLKINIHYDLRRACPDMTRREITLALRSYTGGPTYLESMIEGAGRVDLTGAVVDHVNESHARHAKGRLTTVLKRRAENRQKRQALLEAANANRSVFVTERGIAA